MGTQVANWTQDWTRYQYNHDNGYGAEAGSVLKSLHAAADPASPHGSVISFQGNLCNQPTAIFFAKNNCTSSSFTITVTVKPYPRFGPPPPPSYSQPCYQCWVHACFAHTCSTSWTTVSIDLPLVLVSIPYPVRRTPGAGGFVCRCGHVATSEMFESDTSPSFHHTPMSRIGLRDPLPAMHLVSSHVMCSFAGMIVRTCGYVLAVSPWQYHIWIVMIVVGA